ncbi:MAG: GtrA family protein [Clostridiales bacterium]|nr:GtrA family protein [Clostridiales bacterium]
MIKRIWDWGWDLYRKHKEGFNYLIFGFLAFVLNYVLYWVFESLLHIHYMAATVLSWVLTTAFAYWTNRTFVFQSRNKDFRMIWKELVSFFSARVATEVLELALMYLMVDCLHGNEYVAKLIGQTLVILANYVLSKLWIFKEKK